MLDILPEEHYNSLQVTRNWMESFRKPWYS